MAIKLAHLVLGFVNVYVQLCATAGRCMGRAGATGTRRPLPIDATFLCLGTGLGRRARGRWWGALHRSGGWLNDGGKAYFGELCTTAFGLLPFLLLEDFLDRCCFTT